MKPGRPLAFGRIRREGESGRVAHASFIGLAGESRVELRDFPDIRASVLAERRKGSPM